MTNRLLYDATTRLHPVSNKVAYLPFICVAEAFRDSLFRGEVSWAWSFSRTTLRFLKSLEPDSHLARSDPLSMAFSACCK